MRGGIADPIGAAAEAVAAELSSANRRVADAALA
jgi:hypothetical protein